MGDRRAGVQRGATRRSYGHFCGLARALDQVGDRWAILILRELLGGPRRYTDLHADLPGVSTDILAARLRDLDADGLIERRALSAPASGSVYAITARGEELAPALTALASWGMTGLEDRRSTDAVRAHWHALPLRELLSRAGVTGTIDIVTDDDAFHVRLDGAVSQHPLYGAGLADHADGELTLSVETLIKLCRGDEDLLAAVNSQRVQATGSPLAALDAMDTPASWTHSVSGGASSSPAVR